MTYYTRKEVLQIVEIDEGFLVSLEREEIVAGDAPAGVPGEFSEQMLERVRVAHNLVQDLEVNLPGAAIILRMREEMAELRGRLFRLLGAMRERES